MFAFLEISGGEWNSIFHISGKEDKLGSHVCLRFDEKFRFNLRKFPVTNGRAFSGISGKEVNPARYTEIFGNLLPEISVPLDFHLEFSVELLAFRNFNIFRIFCKRSQRRFLYHFPPF